jgi:hypothetical protein
MDKYILLKLKRYRKTHPQINTILRKLRMTQEQYEKTLAAISMTIPKQRSTYTNTITSRYNANVSTAN